MTINDLVKRICAGRGKPAGNEAFTDLYNKLKRPLLRFAFAMLWDWVAAEDIVQATMMRVFEQACKFDGRYGKAWIFRIAYCLAIDEIRRRRTQAKTGVTSETLQAASMDALEPTVELVRKEYPEAVRKEIERIQKAFWQLDEEERHAVALRDYGGLPYEEAADEMGISDTDFNNTLYRARQKLRKNMGDWQ